MPPGITYLPVASMTVSTFAARSNPSRVDPGASTAAMVSPSMRTSALARPVALTTVPFWMRVFISSPRAAGGSGLCDAGVGVGPAVAVELPVVAHLAHHVQIEEIGRAHV